jgi:hypothetical protein
MVHWQGPLVWVKVVMQLVQGHVRWVLVQAQVLQEGELVVVGKEKLRGQDHNMMPLLRDSIPHKSKALACGDVVRVW